MHNPRFLRAFRSNPAGPPPGQWPPATVLRRWLRRPAFVRALNSVRDALRVQADFHLTSAATHAAQTLADSDPASASRVVHRLTRLLHLAHSRDRFLLHSIPETETDEEEDSYGIPLEYDIRKLDIENRLDDHEFYVLAARYNYVPPLKSFPNLAVPSRSDSPYYRLLASPGDLLWFYKLYNESGNDHRFSPILVNCKHLMREDNPDFPSLEPGSRF